MTMTKDQGQTILHPVHSAFALVLVVDVGGLRRTSRQPAARSKRMMRGNFSIFPEVIRKSRVHSSSSMTSTSPLAFKRTKAKPAQRTRQPSPNSDAESPVTATVDESPSTLAMKFKNKVKKRPKARLSFGGDEDEVCVCISHWDIANLYVFTKESGGEVFQVKKSNLSRKLTLGKHPSSVRFYLHSRAETNYR